MMKPSLIKYGGTDAQSGLGLVEIMISLLISLLLIGGIAEIFSSHKQGYLVQEAQSRLQENTRLASVILFAGIAKTGFRINPEQTESQVFGGLAMPVTGTNDDASDASVLNGTDTATIRFQRDGVVTDCLGIATSPDTGPIGSIAVNIYQVNNGRVLQCDNGAGFRPLMNNVEDFQILYGEDVDKDGSADRYINANQVDDYDDVLSLHMALLLASEGPIRTNAEQITYDVLGEMKAYPQNGADRIQRRVVERVVALRNRLP